MDITIREDGTYDLSSGDIKLLSEDGYIGQTIYCCLMEINSSVYSLRANATSRSYLEIYIKGELSNKLINDPVIDTTLIKVTVESVSDSSILATVTYNGKDLKELTGYTAPTFSFISGASPLIDNNPNWLFYTNDDKATVIHVKQVITVPYQTNMIELPRMPIYNQSDLAIDSAFQATNIYLTKQSLVDVGSARKEQVTITVKDSQKLYPISRYITDLRVNAEVVSSATLYSSTGVISASIGFKDGELCLKTSGAGTVVLDVYISAATTVTSSILIDTDKDKENHIYALKPMRGKVYAVFPKTVKPDTYYLTYNAYNERSIW